VGSPLEQASGLDPVDGGVGAECHAQSPGRLVVVTPAWAVPGVDVRKWATLARQLVSLGMLVSVSTI
jgi:hypothetical protein